MANVSRATTRGVSLETASIIIETALQAARRRKLRPMTIAVLDAGGDLVAFKREDGNGIRRFDVVMGKAVGSLVMNRPSRVIGQIGKANPMFIQSIGAALQGRLIPSPGGVLIKNAEGEIIGAVGSSGDEAEQDEACAIEGIRAAGFVSEPAEPSEDAS